MRTTLLILALTVSPLAATTADAQTRAAALKADANATAAANRAALSATLATAPQSAPSDANPTRPRRGPMRAGRLPGDTDRDGVVTRAEALARADAQFARMDADGDGILTAAERDAARDAMRDRRQARMDARRDARGEPGGEPRGSAPGPRGNDGIVTRAEFQDRAAQRFDRMDANRDGRIDPAERPDRRAMRHARRGGAHRAMAPDAAPRAESDDDR